jgi:hypothetical protein
MAMKLAPYLLLVAAALSPGMARASGSFPGAIRADLTLDYTPPCSLCHVNNNPGSTAWSPFVIALRAQGLEAGKTPALFQAIERLDAMKTDSDGDGVSDIDELRNDTDPNSVADVTLSGETLGHGCNGAHPTGHDRVRGGFGVVIALLCASYLRRIARREPGLGER